MKFLSILFGTKCECGQRYRNASIHFLNCQWIKHNTDTCFICLEQNHSFHSFTCCQHKYCMNCYYKMEKCPFCRIAFPMTDLLFTKLLFHKISTLPIDTEEDEIHVFELYQFILRHQRILRKHKFRDIRLSLRFHFNQLYQLGFNHYDI